MKAYQKYINEIQEREAFDLNPKPIDNADLLNDIILQIKKKDHPERKRSINFFIYNVL